MKENKLYSCPNCKSILVIPKSCWQPVIKCPVCDKGMILLYDEEKYGELYFEKIYSK